jgi:hypothetical protein
VDKELVLVLPILTPTQHQVLRSHCLTLQHSAALVLVEPEMEWAREEITATIRVLVPHQFVPHLEL